MLEDFVSVIIPARNEEGYLEERSLPSVAKQTYRNSEAIVVCNACTDRTEEAAEEFRRINKNLRLRILSVEKPGVSHARNIGAEASTGNLLVFLDADIYMAENTIEQIVNFKQKYGNILGSCMAKPAEKNIRARLFVLTKNYLPGLGHLANGIIFCDRETYQKIGGFNESKDKWEIREFLKKGREEAVYNPRLKSTYVVMSMRRFEKGGYRNTIINEWFNPLKKDYAVVR